MDFWSSYDLNAIAVVVSAFVFAVNLDNLHRILTPLLRCTFLWRASFSFERNLQLSRTRNVVSATLILPFCIVADRFALREPATLSHTPAEWHLISTVGLFAAFCFLRLIAHFCILSRPEVDRTAVTVAWKSDRNTFILWGCLSVLTACLAGAFSLDGEIAKAVFLIENAAIYMLHTARKAHILRSAHPLFATILYLCALELIPTGAAMACTFFF